MKFKLDENFGTRTQEIFREAGHDVKTVRDEALSGTSDDNLYQVCQIESRCLVTLDLDFANTLCSPLQIQNSILPLRSQQTGYNWRLLSKDRIFVVCLNQENILGLVV